MTKGTRRSAWPVTATVNNLQQEKIDKFTSIGYEVVADNGYSALLSYYPYSSSYVKLARIEGGRLKSTIQLTPKQLRELSKRVDEKKARG